MCSVDFQVAKVTQNAITTNLTIHCNRGMLRYEVHAISPMDQIQHVASSANLHSMESTLITVSGLLTSTNYDLVLQLMDHQCANSTSTTILNVTTTAAETGE